METLASDVLAPANADTTTDATTNADAKVETTTGDGSAPSATEAGTPAPKKDAVQERFDKLTREKYDALRERDRQGYELETLRERLAALETAKAEPVAPDEFPTLEKFGYDEAKYQAAVAEYFADIAEKRADERVDAKLSEVDKRREAQKANESWAKKEAEFIKSKQDYAEKVIEGGKRGDWKCTPEMAQLIKESPFGTSIAYHLAENSEKSSLISSLPPLAQAREIGRIEASIEAAKATKPPVSQAPPPVAKVDATDAQVEKSPADMSDNEFNKWRKKQIAARRNN